MQHFLKFTTTRMVCVVMVWLVITAESAQDIRIMAANLNGNTQSYQPFALRILQGLKPDVVCIQEFNYGGNAAADFRSMLDTCLGTNYVYYREPFTGNGDIPNGIISRFPIVAAGSWADTVQSSPNRGFAWAQIGIPGTNALYVVSVHLLTSSAANRGAEAANLQALIRANFPTNAWVVVAGDFNTDTRTELPTMTTFGSYLSDTPIPDDGHGNAYTSGGRNHPHDYVLPSFNFTNVETASVLPSHAFPNGLVFDSSVYSPLSDVAPVQATDSTNAQHMAVIKDFLIAGTSITNPPSTNAPVITMPPQNQTVSPGSNATLRVTASGAAPLAFQWYFNAAALAGATNSSVSFMPVALTNTGTYFVVVSNLVGGVTSAPAVFTVSNFAPVILAGPQSQTLSAGSTATFTVTAGGTAPLAYQWLLAGAPITGASGTTYALSNAQTNNSGSYSVVVTNVAGSVTSSVAMLSVLSTNPTVIAQWNFNSVTPDNSTSTGSTVPSMGSGTASLLSGNTASFATGDTGLDPAGTTDNSGWNTTSYPAQGTGNKTRGVQFAISTAGKQTILVSWSSQSSATGSKYGRLQYTTNGTDYYDYPVAFTNGTTYTPKTNSLTAVGVNNNPNFAIRLVSEYESTALGTANNNYVAAGATSTYGTAGTMRYDLVTIYGTSIISNTLPAAPILGAVVLGAGQLRFTVSGTSGSSYVVQATTNLVIGSWVALFTNAAPFTFTEAKVAGSAQKFYRAVTGQ